MSISACTEIILNWIIATNSTFAAQQQPEEDESDDDDEFVGPTLPSAAGGVSSCWVHKWT